MLAHLEQAIFYIMGQPLIMGVWVGFASMVYLLQNQVNRFRKMGELRLFGTSLIMAVAIPLATTIVGRVLATQFQGSTRQIVVVLFAPILIILVFALAMTLIQRFIGADAETAMSLSWPITLITYVAPLVLSFIYALFQDKWLGTSDSPYY